MEFRSIEKCLVLVLLNETQNCVCIIMPTIAICLLIEKKYLSSKLRKKVNFATEFCLASISNGLSATESREMYFLMEMCMIFQSITILLIHLTY